MWLTRIRFTPKSNVRSYKTELKPQLITIVSLKDIDQTIIVWLTRMRVNPENGSDVL